MGEEVSRPAAGGEGVKGALRLIIDVDDMQYGVFYGTFSVPHGAGGAIEPTLEQALDDLRATVVRHLATAALGGWRATQNPVTASTPEPF